MIVIIKVGPQKETFTMHKETLSNSSLYFEAALEGKFKEAKNSVIELPEDDVEIFRVFQIWLYTGQLLLTRDRSDHIWNLFTWETLVDLYIFGECRLISGFLNPVMDLLIRKPEAPREIPVYLATYIYNNTYHGSWLREWISHATAYATPFTGLAAFPLKHFTGFSKDFLSDLAVAYKFTKKRGCRDGLICLSNKCDYHARDANGTCYRN